MNIDQEPAPNGYHPQAETNFSGGLSHSRAATLTGFEDDPVEERTKDPTPAAEAEETAAPKDPKDAATERQHWASPFNKLGFVLGGSSIVVLVAFFFLNNLTKPIPKPATKAEVQSFPTPPPEDPRDRENGKLLAEVALSDQAAAQARLEENEKNNPQTTQGATNPDGKTRTTPTRPQRVATPPPPRATTASTSPRSGYSSVSVSSSRPRRSYASYSTPRSYARANTPPRTSYTPTVASATSPTSVDPLEQWLASAQLGSYGQVASDPAEPATETASVVGVDPELSDNPAISEVEQPVSPIRQALGVRSTPGSMTRTSAAPIQVASTQLTIDTEAESVILSGQPMRMLNAGAKAPGVLTTPMVWDETGPKQQLVVLLSQPLLASDGKVALPAGTQILTEAQSLSKEGIVRMVAVAALIESNGQQVEQPLPQTALLVHGDNGDPLRAEKTDDRGPEIARMDMFSFALGAISRAAELFTRPTDSVSVFNSAGGSVAQTNPEPNILAGVLEGGTETLMDELEERNDRAMEDIANRPNISFLPAGTEVEIYVAKSTPLPSAFSLPQANEPSPVESTGGTR